MYLLKTICLKQSEHDVCLGNLDFSALEAAGLRVFPRTVLLVTRCGSESACEVCTYMCICIYILYIFMYIYIYIYILTLTHPRACISTCECLQYTYVQYLYKCIGAYTYMCISHPGIRMHMHVYADGMNFKMLVCL